MNNAIAEEAITKNGNSWKQEYKSAPSPSDDCFFAQRSPAVQEYFQDSELMSDDEKYIYSSALTQNCAEELAREQFLIARKQYAVQLGVIGGTVIGVTAVAVVGGSYLLNQNSEQNNLLLTGLAASSLTSGGYVQTTMPPKRTSSKRDAFKQAKELCKKFEWNCRPQSAPGEEEYFFSDRKQRHQKRIQELLFASQQLNSISEDTYLHWREWTSTNVKLFMIEQKRTEANPWIIRKNIKDLQSNLRQLEEDIPKIVVIQNVAQKFNLSPSANAEFSRFTDIEKIPVLLEALQKEIDILENTTFPESMLSMDKIEEGWREQQFIFEMDGYSSAPQSCTFKIKKEEREAFPKPLYSLPMVIEMPYNSSSLPQGIYGIPFEMPITSLQDLKTCLEKAAKKSQGQIGSNRAKQLAAQIDFFFPSDELEQFVQKKNIETVGIQAIDSDELPPGVSQKLLGNIKSELRATLPADVKIIDNFQAEEIPPNMLLIKTSFREAETALFMEIFGETADGKTISLHIEEFPIEVPNFRISAPKEVQVHHPDGTLSTVPLSCYKLNSRSLLSNPICTPLLRPLQNPADTPEELKSNDNPNTRYISYAGVTKGTFNLKFTLTNRSSQQKSVFLPMGTIVKPKDPQKAVGIVALDASFSIGPNESVILTVPVYCQTGNLSLPNEHEYELSSMQLSSNLLQDLKEQPANKRQEWLWLQEKGTQ